MTKKYCQNYIIFTKTKNYRISCVLVAVCATHVPCNVISIHDFLSIPVQNRSFRSLLEKCAQLHEVWPKIL